MTSKFFIINIFALILLTILQGTALIVGLVDPLQHWSTLAVCGICPLPLNEAQNGLPHLAARTPARSGN